MTEQNLNPDALDVLATVVFSCPLEDWNEHDEDEKRQLLAPYTRIIDTYLSALPAQPDTVNSVRRLHLLDAGTVVQAEGGSVWKKFNRGMGVWFKVGDSLDYEASVIPLPATVLYRPVK